MPQTAPESAGVPAAEARGHYERGLALRGRGEKRAALASFEQAVTLQHDHVPAIFHAGELHAELGEVEEARDCFTLALAFDPRSSASRIALAQLLAEHQGMAPAVELLSEAVEGGSADAAVFCRLAGLLGQGGDLDGAARTYRAAIGRFPDEAAPLVNLGLHHLIHTGDAAQAEELFRRALQLAPGLVEAQANLGLVLQEQGRFEEALAHYERLIARSPEVAEYRYNRGLANLALGRFGAGWDDYELRKGRLDAGGVHALYPFAEWDGSPLEGRAVLAYGEQGVGDEIMFASCLSGVIERAALTVIECDARLAPLYRRSFPRARIEPRGSTRVRDWRATCPALELQVAVGSLPRHLRRSAADFPRGSGYLSPDPARTLAWRSRLARAGAPALVGLSWRGGTLRTRGALRSLPFAALEPLLECPGAHFVVLQRDVGAEERAWLERRGNVSLPQDVSDLDELAALLGVLDLTIAVPGTNVHLAGALGRPVWALLTESPEWRYLWRGERMPWYPSVRLFRQPAPGDWTSLVRRVAQELERLPRP